MPSALAHRIEGVIGDSPCQRNSKRDVSLRCVSEASQNIILNAQAGLSLHDLVLIQGQFPQFQVADAARVVNQAADFARQMAPELRVTAPAAAAFGTIAFALAYHSLVGGGFLATENYFPASELAKESMTAGPGISSASSCASTGILCPDADCKGDTRH